MASNLLGRLALAVSTVVTVSFVAFATFGVALDPTYPLILGGRHNPERVALQKEFHLTDPILKRYWLWVKQLPTRGFGTTVMAQARPDAVGHDRRIGPALWSAAWASAQLVAASLVVVLLFSIAVGTLSAWRPHSSVDLVLRLLSYLAVSVPTFLLAVLLGWWLYPIPLFSGPPRGATVQWLREMALPVAAVSAGLVGLYARYVRSAMLVALNEPYVGVARAKGASDTRVLLRHALRNSLIPLLTILALDIGAVVGVSLAADFWFDVGGLASLLVYALGRADPFALTAIVVVLSGVVVTFTLVVDLALGWLDPRLRSG